jgi:hypothetical protein
MTPKRDPNDPRRPYSDAVFVEINAQLIPGDSPESLSRERKGRPVRTPPDEPKPDDTPPPA